MAYENDVLTRNENDELAVRVVQSVGDNPASSYDDIYTRDTNGKLAVRVVGAGGGDSHNKGYFATQSALETEYPTAEAGDYAIVGETDTVWIWDDDTDSWVDTDTKGEVTSVNGQTGEVELSAEDVGAVPQYSSMPQPNQEGDIVQYVGTTNQNYTNGYFYQVGVAGEEIIDGECDVDIETFQGGDDNDDLPPPTFDLDFSVLESYLASRNKPQITSPIVDIMVEYNQYNNLVIWFEYNKDEDAGTHESVEVVTSGDTISDTVSGLATLGFTVDLTGFTYLSYADLTLPTEDVFGWVQKDVQPEKNSLGVYKDYSEIPEPTAENVGTPYLVTPYDSETLSPYSPELFMSVPYIMDYISGEAEVTGYGLTPETQPTDIMIDWATLESYLNSQETGFDWSNDTINISLNGENFLGVYYNADFSASAGVQTDGTVANIQQALENIGISVDLTGYTQFQFVFLKLPTEKGYENRQVPAFVPTSGTEEIDYVLKADGNGGAYWAEEASGLPDQTGQSGKFLTTDGTDASWAAVNALPSQTGNSGKFLTTDGTDASWGTTITQSLTVSNATSDIVLSNTGSGFKIAKDGVEFIFDFAVTGGISPSGSYAAYKKLGSSSSKWDYIYATKISNGSDIAVPNTAGTMVVVDYTGATQGQVLTLGANNNAVWQTPSTAVTSTTATLVVANWSSNTQTLTVNGVTSSNVVIVSPQPLSAGDYASAGVLCTAQNTNSLTFTCTQTPSNAIDLSIVIIG